MERPSRRRARLWFLAVLFGAIAVAWACGDGATTGPELQPSFHSARAARDTGLVRCSETPYASDPVTMGAAGGWISAGAAMLVVPRGALGDTVTITVETVADTLSAVRLLPEGLVFLKPAYLVLSYANCKTPGKRTSKRIAYTNDSWAILEYLRSWDLGKSKRVVGELSHFSNYAVAW